MTTTEKALLGTAAAVGGALLLYYFLIKPMGTDEDGIRVKNGGSVDITTVSSQGFVKSGNDYQSKGSAGPQFSVTVTTNDSCVGPNPLSGVTSVTFATDGPGSVPTDHRIEAAGKYVTHLVGNWTLDAQGQLNLPNVSLRSMSARGIGAVRLDCTFTGNALTNEISLARP